MSPFLKVFHRKRQTFVWVITKSFRDKLLHPLYRLGPIRPLEQARPNLEEFLEGPKEILVQYEFVPRKEPVLHVPHDRQPSYLAHIPQRYAKLPVARGGGVDALRPTGDESLKELLI